MANIKLSNLVSGNKLPFIGENRFTASAGQTTFNVNYTPPYVKVYQNGIKLEKTVDYTATDGSTVVLTTGASDGDSIMIDTYAPTSVADAAKGTNQVIAGAGLSGGGSISSDVNISLSKWNVYSSNTTLNPFEKALVDTTISSVTISLPTSPDIGIENWFADSGRNWNTNNLIVDGNGNQILGSNTYTANTNDQSFSLVYNGTQWVLGSRV